MALTSVTSLDKKENADWTREQRLIVAIQDAKRSGRPLNPSELSDLLDILTAVDDYAKGTATSMNTIQTNYTTWTTKKNRDDHKTGG